MGTRIPADAVLDNAEDGYSPEDIAAEIDPSLALERARRILAFARERVMHRVLLDGRVLLDEGVPIGVRSIVVGFTVGSAPECGWAGLTNGDLIEAAEATGYE